MVWVGSLVTSILFNIGAFLLGLYFGYGGMQSALGADVSDDTWRQWLLEWAPTPGLYLLKVRATDKTGETQTELQTPVAPNGATGYHTIRVKVE